MSQIILSSHDDIAVIRLERPEALNAISGRTVIELNAALDRIARDNCRGLVITGAGRAFCAGADLKERDFSPLERVADMHRLVLRLVEFPKVSVAAINGIALGGGLELAMSCTLRVASPSAMLGLPEARTLGVHPGYGGTQLLPRLVGTGKALEMILTGEPVDSRQAEQIGLVNRVSDDCLSAAIDLARAASVALPEAIGAVKHLVAASRDFPLVEGLGREAAATAELAGKVRMREAAKPQARDGTGRQRETE